MGSEDLKQNPLNEGERVGSKKEESVIKLPGESEMLARLVEVDGDPYMKEKFYPLLLREAGQEKYPSGVVMFLQLALHEYSKDFPPVVAAQMHMRATEFLDALIPDTVAAQEAKELYRQSTSA